MISSATRAAAARGPGSSGLGRRRFSHRPERWLPAEFGQQVELPDEHPGVHDEDPVSCARRLAGWGPAWWPHKQGLSLAAIAGVSGRRGLLL